jgi:hypothetical protein
MMSFTMVTTIHHHLPNLLHDELVNNCHHTHTHTPPGRESQVGVPNHMTTSSVASWWLLHFHRGTGSWYRSTAVNEWKYKSTNIDKTGTYGVQAKNNMLLLL